MATTVILLGLGAWEYQSTDRVLEENLQAPLAKIADATQISTLGVRIASAHAQAGWIAATAD